MLLTSTVIVGKFVPPAVSTPLVLLINAAESLLATVNIRELTVSFTRSFCTPKYNTESA